MGWKPQWHISKSKILEPAKETGRKCKQRDDIGWEFHSPRAGSTQVTWRETCPSNEVGRNDQAKRFSGACSKRWKHPPNIESLISPCNVFSSAFPKEITQYEPESVCPAQPRVPDEMTFWHIQAQCYTPAHGKRHSTQHKKTSQTCFFLFWSKKETRRQEKAYLLNVRKRIKQTREQKKMHKEVITGKWKLSNMQKQN